MCYTVLRIILIIKLKVSLLNDENKLARKNQLI